MPIDAAQILVAVGGKIMIATNSTPAPVDEAAAWPAGWIDFGIANNDGVRIAAGFTREDIDGWQVLDPVRVLTTARSISLAFTLRQLNQEALKLAFQGGSVTTISPGHLRYDLPADAQIDERALGIEAVDGAKVARVIVPRAYVSENVEIPLTKGGPAEVPITMRVLATTGASPAYILGNTAALAATP